MSWNNEMVIIVRHIIGDLDTDNYSFSDSRIEESILVAAQLIHNEMEFTINYDIEVDNGLLTPDPTTTAVSPSNKDDDFIALCCLRSGLLLTNSLLRTYSLKAISIRDGSSSLDMRGVVAGLKLVNDDLTKKYEAVKMSYETGKLGLGKVILSPYSPGSDNANRGYVDYRAGLFN
jgi:hypothetical protein